MPNDSLADLKFEIGHVLFIDIVGYSKLSINEQSAQLETLKKIVRGTEQFRQAEAEGKLLRLPTGDGGALVFRNRSEAPVLCAIEIQRALQQPPGSKEKPQLRLRMGIHSGPVNEITDLNQQANVAGAGINYAQRVMDCGDAGHILLSRHVAEDLETFDRWRPLLHDLGECEVKHGVRVGITNLYSDEVGNSSLPSKLQAVRKHRAHVRWAEAVIALVVLGAIIAASLYFLRRGPAPSVANIADKSVAVLPFVNMSSDKEQEFFSDGISEELLNLLSKVPELHVAARTSSFFFKGKQAAIPEIARQLHVAHVLEGSVRKNGDEVRITTQLVRATEGYHLWSETYDRKLDDIFKVQDEIAAEVVKQLKIKLLGAAPTVRQTDPRCYAFYLQARELGRQHTAEAFQQSDALLQQALAIDPNYAPAWVELSRNFTEKASNGLLSNEEGTVRGREAAEKALAADLNYAPAHAQLGFIAAISSDLTSAARHLERAIALDPTDLTVLGNAAYLLQSLGRVDDALALYQAIVRRDPVNVNALHDLSNAQEFAHHYDAAITSCRSILSLSPGRAQAHFTLGNALLLKGDGAAALGEFEQETSEAWRMIALPMAYHALGRDADADKALEALIAKYARDAPYNIAFVYAFRGDAEKAFAWLDKAVEYQDPGFGQILAENLFDNIRSDPRWLPFLRKIGKAPEQVAKIQFKVTLPPQ